MKIKGLFILLLLCTWSLSVSAQDKASFPITGTFKLQPEQGVKKDFNKVIITKDGYSVLKDEKVLRTYKVLYKDAEGYHVEQYFEGSGNEKRDKARFAVKLDKESNTDYYISVLYGGYTERIHLIRSK